MFQIGSALREARERRGLTLADVERETRIRARHLAALEDERFDRLPADVYTRGFLRSYAEFLGLDSGLFLDAYDARVPEPEPVLLPPPQLRPRAPISRRTLALAAFAAAVAGVGLLAWRFGGGESESPAPLATAGPSTRAHVAVKRPVKVRRPAQPRPVVARLVVVASRGRCWLLVREGSKSGGILYEGILEQGRSVRFARRSLWVRMGAPWNVEARLNGKPVAGIVSGGRPVNVLVTPAGIRVV